MKANGATQMAATTWRYVMRAKMKVPLLRMTRVRSCRPVAKAWTISIPTNAFDDSKHFFTDPISIRPLGDGRGKLTPLPSALKNEEYS
ncbi:hypothetical protein CRG98_010974 [Punica granatum]|uniref:Uncharacterized protein n=1 Tax=Punica granatum TaxID=22663 RepID=A0A2I0KJK6_PUNGR|nr:hypothetical protein CRG98_010974 [Punica granatum]